MQTKKLMGGSAADYSISIKFNTDPTLHPITATVKAHRYNDGTDFHGKSVPAVLKKVADWIEGH